MNIGSLDPFGETRQIQVTFQAEDMNVAVAWKDAGWAALEQVEADLSSEGVPIIVTPGAPGEGQRGFTDALVVNIVADAITALLMRTVTDLFSRWQRTRHAAAAASAPAGAPYASEIILCAGDQRLVLAANMPGEQVYQQLSLWTPQVIESGGVIFEVSDARPV